MNTLSGNTENLISDVFDFRPGVPCSVTDDVYTSTLLMDNALYVTSVTTQNSTQ